MKSGQKFTVGIDDDITHLSLTVGGMLPTAPTSMCACQFYGMGSDGSVGATKQTAEIISELSGDYVQAYFEYSAKKSGGYTVSSLRVDKSPIECEYALHQVNYIGINKERYAAMFDIAPLLAKNGILTINTAKNAEQLFKLLPSPLVNALKEKKVRLYTVDAVGIAAKNNLGVRINTIMETAFFKLNDIVDFGKAKALVKEKVKDMYIHEGEDVVKNNWNAIDQTESAIHEISIDSMTSHSSDSKDNTQWVGIADDVPSLSGDTITGAASGESENLANYVRTNAEPCLHRNGDKLPVSAFTPDGIVPVGETAFEKRTIALQIPVWDVDKCTECTMCSLVCAHAAIRPYDMEKSDLATRPANGINGMQWRIQVSPRDCTGCGSCAVICPGHALTMTDLESVFPEEDKAFVEVRQLPLQSKALPRFTVRGSQLQRPLLEFSGACAGCGETPYVKLLTQLFGERMVIANATGCSSIWGADYPSMPYCANDDGHGPAWANSLFEDNAEYGMGIALALKQRGVDASVWAIGGDGWAYDIGYAGLDHVISQNLNINILVMDTECYSNTGGQMSKATPLGCIAKYAPDGKRTVKKDLGRMAMTYGHVYVAYISLAANPAQAIKVFQEAEAYDGPSLIIAYCPCINHGIRAGMSHAAVEMREAVKCGYWPLWHFNPNASPQLSVDSADPDGSLAAFLNGEDRYADLNRVDPNDVQKLHTELSKRLDTVREDLKSAVVPPKSTN